MWILSESLILLTILALLFFLFNPKIRKSSFWQATITPLASIIGSGFLIIAPLLILTVGRWAILAMGLIVLLGYLLGSVMRFNIHYVEPVLVQKRKKGSLLMIAGLEELAKFALVVAYMISVGFYLKLLAAFSLREFPFHSALIENCMVTVVLISLMAVGAYKGFSVLEILEEYSVSGKLAVIGGFCMALVIFNLRLYLTGQWEVTTPSRPWDFGTWRSLAGMLIVVQGFETSRYLTEEFSRDKRVRSMRLAQWISGGIYLCFIALATVALNGHIGKVTETQIIVISRKVSWVIPWFLIGGAMLSQFSAAVADMAGGGGMIFEATQKKLSENHGYLVIGLASLILIWTTDIFQITNYASRGFAVYYLIQTTQALVLAFNHRKILQTGLFFILAMIMLFIVIFGIPATA